MRAIGPETTFALATALVEIIDLLATQGEAINAALGELHHGGDDGAPPPPAPYAVLPGDNLCLLKAELTILASRIRVTSRTLQQVRRNTRADGQPTVSRETSRPKVPTEQ